MTIYSVFDPMFKPYGKVLDAYDVSELQDAMMAIPLPESGTAYEAGISSLEDCGVFEQLKNRAFGFAIILPMSVDLRGLNSRQREKIKSHLSHTSQ